MTYIKPPTQKEKEEYWDTAKDITLIFIYMIIGLAAISTFGYFFYKYTDTMIYCTAISLAILLISTAFVACYSQLYIS